MVDRSLTALLATRLIYVGLAMALIFFLLLPLDPAPGRLAGPDLLLALTLSWTIRRPEVVPVTTIAAVFLIADLLLQRPPGLWAALVLLMTEGLRRRSPAFRTLPFVLEWTTVASFIVVATLAYNLILMLFLLATPPIGLTVSQVVTTLLAYPFVVALSHFALGLRKTAPGEVDTLGHRL